MRRMSSFGSGLRASMLSEGDGNELGYLDKERENGTGGVRIG